MTSAFPVPHVAAGDLTSELRRSGYAVLSPIDLMQLLPATSHELDALRPGWNDLPLDGYLRDGGRYRRRRHASYVISADQVRTVPRRPHWQPVEYNALHGGLERWFEPIVSALEAAPVWRRLLQAFARVASALWGPQPWFVEAHQFRIDTTDGVGRPTPEGAHRDGVDLVVVVLVERRAIKGGETRVFDADGPNGRRFTLIEPWSTLWLDDARVIHESTPIQPVEEGVGYRDTVVLTARAGDFQASRGA
jgi:hypothetical protein